MDASGVAQIQSETPIKHFLAAGRASARFPPRRRRAAPAPGAAARPLPRCNRGDDAAEVTADRDENVSESYSYLMSAFTRILLYFKDQFFF